LEVAGDGKTYEMHFLLQDLALGRIYSNVFPPLKRSLAQIFGFTQMLAKTEKENDVGRSAQRMLDLLLDPSTSKVKK